jgi:hypothetical protein
LLHKADVVLGHLLRVGQDLGHQHWYPNLAEHIFLIIIQIEGLQLSTSRPEFFIRYKISTGTGRSLRIRSGAFLAP